MTHDNYSSPAQYGGKYWCIKVLKGISANGEIYVHGDEVTVTSSGALVVNRVKDGIRQPNIVIAAGDWVCIYAASITDGSAVAVEHWAGEVCRE